MGHLNFEKHYRDKYYCPVHIILLIIICNVYIIGIKQYYIFIISKRNKKSKGMLDNYILVSKQMFLSYISVNYFSQMWHITFYYKYVLQLLTALDDY